MISCLSTIPKVSDILFVRTYVLAEKAEENPKTYDGIINSIFAGSISLIGLVCVIIYLKKEVM